VAVEQDKKRCKVTLPVGAPNAHSPPVASRKPRIWVVAPVLDGLLTVSGPMRMQQDVRAHEAQIFLLRFSRDGKRLG